MAEAEQRTRIQDVLARRRELEGKKDGLANAARTLVDGVSRLPEKAQLQNLRTLAAETDSLEELRIYIQYQMSRSGQPLQPEVGTALLGALDKLPRDMDQIRLFLGFFYRYATYAAAVQNAGRRGEGR